MSTFAAYEPNRRATSPRGNSSSKLKFALCIGIDKYPDANDRLNGCVNDAKRWGNWFESQGFETQVITDSQASRTGIQDAIEQVIQNATPGSVIAIQYSGHGTQLPDFGQDESDELDEALVPFDHRHNGYLTDDDIASACDQIPPGVNVTFFMDCCHSGSNTRQLFLGSKSGLKRSVAKTRFLRADEEMIAAHRKQCRANRKRASRTRSSQHREILFSACRPEQTSKERDGQGDFSRAALQILADGTSGLTNATFLEEVLSLGTFESQNPQLWSETSLHNLPFLSPISRLEKDIAIAPSSNTKSSALQEVAEELQRIVDKIRSL